MNPSDTSQARPEQVAPGDLLAGAEMEYGYLCDERCTQPHLASEESARTKVKAMRNGKVVRRLAGPWVEVRP